MVTNCVEAVCTTLLSCALRAWRLVGEILIGFSAYEPYVGFHGSVRDNTLMPITGVDLRALVVRGKFVFVAQIGSPQKVVYELRDDAAPPGVDLDVLIRGQSINRRHVSQIHYLLTFCILFVCFF